MNQDSQVSFVYVMWLFLIKSFFEMSIETKIY